MSSGPRRHNFRGAGSACSGIQQTQSPLLRQFRLGPGITVLRVALLQINPIAGDLKGNASQIIRGVRAAKDLDVDLVVTPACMLNALMFHGRPVSSSKAFS